jgi:hypothetical protein
MFLTGRVGAMKRTSVFGLDYQQWKSTPWWRVEGKVKIVSPRENVPGFHKFCCFVGFVLAV